MNRDSCMLDMDYGLWVWCETSKKIYPWDKVKPNNDFCCRSNSDIVSRFMDAGCLYAFILGDN